MQDTLKNILTPHQAAALNYKNHISLTANAGSGKTFVLSRRYLEIALNENIPLRNIAAITFTDKAAGELYRKIAAEIEKRLSDNPDESLRKKLGSIRRQLVSSNISTIHSFCIDILREYPVEASLDANFRAIDESLSNELVELSVEETIKSAFDNSEDSEDLKYLIRVFASKRIFAEELFSLIKNRKNVFDIAQTIYTKSEKEIAEYFYQNFSELVHKIYISRKDYLHKNLQTINNAVLEISRRNKLAVPASAFIEELKVNLTAEKYLNIINSLLELIFTKSNKRTIKKTGYMPGDVQIRYPEQVDFVEMYFNEIKTLLLTQNHFETETELARFGKKVIKFFNKASDLYEEKKKENGYLDFEDILLNTRKILKNKNVKLALSEKYKYIMVDEYQDTNEIQYQIFLPILDDLKAGNLFIVGDEKQSIYMFRDAELEVFSETKKNIEDTSGKDFLLMLPDSFRMAPGICLFANTVFGNLFNDPNEFYNEVENSELVCARNESVKGKVEILIGGEDETGPDSEPELVAKKILRLINEEKENINWADIAVLVRKRKNFNPLEKIFSKYKIPFSIVGGTGFYQKQSVYDIYNYFSFLLDRNNDTALVGILRSPFFNISDAQIFEISREKGFRFWNKLFYYCKDKPEISGIYKILEVNLVLVKSCEPTFLLRKILNETNYLSVLTSKPNGTQELANLEKLINLTTSFNQQSFRTVYDYLNYLKESIERTDDESQAAVAEESNSVKIMTLHQAKGLEYKAIFLFKCDEISQMNSITSKKITAVKKAGLLTKVPVKENYFFEYEPAPVVNIYNHIIRKKEIAEIKRLLYVGITRAMDYLYISSSFKKNYKYSDASFTGLLTEALNPNFDSQDYKISSKLKFLMKKNDKYITEEKPLSLSIPIIKKIDEIDNIEALKETGFLPGKLNTDKINDLPEGEIISATKLSIFYQCPLKYQLTYEFGFTKLMEQFKDWRSSQKERKYEFNPYEENAIKDDDEKSFRNYGDIKGRIIHKILQKEIDQPDLMETALEMIKYEQDILDETNISYNDFANEIVSDLNKYYESAAYSEISNQHNCKNEFEVYSKEGNYFLFGIIDRIAIEGNKAVIIDFKTDDIEKSEIQQRFESYLTQLKFYSYIVSRLYKNILEFELKIIFIKHPGEKVSIKIKRNELDEIRNSVMEMVLKTRKGNYPKNLAHCSKCIFSINHNKCIVN
jgi:ATP-dependent helicase/nuclease subunit A